MSGGKKVIEVALRLEAVNRKVVASQVQGAGGTVSTWRRFSSGYLVWVKARLGTALQRRNGLGPFIDLFAYGCCFLLSDSAKLCVWP